MFDSFFPYSQKVLGFDKQFSLNFASDQENSANPLGKTAHYDPSSSAITIYVDGRHIKDIMRSISHELVHHAQNCRGEFDKGISTDAGYAQTDNHLRGMESEAYEKGNLCFRDWEDQYKQLRENKMTKLAKEEIKKLLKEGGIPKARGKVNRMLTFDEEQQLEIIMKSGMRIGTNLGDYGAWANAWSNLIDTNLDKAKEMYQKAARMVKRYKNKDPFADVWKARKKGEDAAAAMQTATTKKAKAKRRRRMAVAVQKELVDIFGVVENPESINEAVGNIMQKTIGASRFDGDIGKTTLESLQKIIPLKGLVNSRRDAYRNLGKILKILKKCRGQESKCYAKPKRKPVASKAASKAATPAAPKDNKLKLTHDEVLKITEPAYKKCIAKMEEKLPGLNTAKPAVVDHCRKVGNAAFKKWRRGTIEGIPNLEESKVDFTNKHLEPVRKRFSTLFETLVKKGNKK